MRLALTMVAVMLLCAAGTAGLRLVWRERPAVVAAAPDVAELLPTQGVAPDESYERLEVVPYDLPRYGFSLVVPRRWRWRRFDLTRIERGEDDRRPLPMAEFGPQDNERGGNRVLVEARYVRVPSQVTLARFVDVYAMQSGFAVQVRQTRKSEGVEVEEVLMRKSEPEPFLTRLAVQRNGPILFLVAGTALEADYPRWKQELAVAVLSFSPRTAGTR